MATPAAPISVAPAASAAPAAVSAPSVAVSSSPSPASVPSTPAAQPANQGTGLSPVPAVPAVSESVQPPVVEQPAAPQGEPKNTDFPESEDGQNEFAMKHAEWRAKQQGPGDQGTKGPEGEAAKPEGEAKPGEPAAAKPTAPETPEQWSKLMEQKPALKNLLDADPEVKEMVFAQSRQLATAKPILEIAPTVAHAEFLRDRATEMVGLKTASMRMVENPESVPEFLNLFDSSFQRLDEKGQPVLDAQGKPVYDADRQVAISGLIGRELSGYDQQFKSEMEQLQSKLQTGVYPNEGAKALDQKRLNNMLLASDAINIANMVLSGKFFEEEAPEIPADASAEFRAWAEKERKEIADRKAEAEGKQSATGKQQRAAAKAQFTAEVKNQAGADAGTMIGTQLKQLEDAGAYIPEMYKQELYRDPATGQTSKVPALVADIWLAYEREVNLQPNGRPYPETDISAVSEQAQFELLPQNAQTKAAIADWHRRQMASRMPRLVQKAVERIQNLVKLDQGKMEERAAARRQAASPEPQSAGSGLQQGETDAEIFKAVDAEMAANPALRNLDSEEYDIQRVSRYWARKGGKK